MTPTIIIAESAGGFLLTLKRMTRETFAPAIDALKRTVPPSSRSFEPDTKQWFVAFAAEPQMRAWLGYMTTAHAATIEFAAQDNGDEYERAYKPHKANLDPFEVLHLLPSAPPEVVRAAYKALAVKLHPDKPTGDTVAMQRLNAAYSQIAA